MLFFNISLWLMLASIVVGHPKGFSKKKHEIEDALNRAKMFHMGFMDPINIADRSTSLSCSNRILRTIYKQLQCSYALFAMRHVRIIEEIMADPIGLVVNGDFKTFLFDEEGAAMLAASIHDAGLHGVKNVMWAFWLYADRWHRFLESTENSGTVDKLNHAAIYVAHEAVYAVLDRFLTSYECKSYNAGEKLWHLRKLILQIADPADKLNSMIALILDNKRVFVEQNISNSNLGVLTTGRQRISMRTLSLDGLDRIQTIVDRSVGTEFWETIENRLSSEYNKAMALGVPLSKQAKLLINFQKELTDTLKLIALHFGRHFLLSTASAGNLVKDSLEARKMKFNVDLIRLDHLMESFTVKPLGTINTMDYLMSCIRTCIIFIFQSSVEDTENKITSILARSPITPIDLSKFSINTGYPINSDQYHASVVEQLESFVNITKQVLSDVDLTIVKSFVEYTSSEECNHVAEF